MLLLLGSSCACSSFGSSSCTCNRSCSCKWKADQARLLSCFCNKEWGCTEMLLFKSPHWVLLFVFLTWSVTSIFTFLLEWENDGCEGEQWWNEGWCFGKKKKKSTGKYIDHPKSRSWWWFDMFMLVSICFI